MVSETGSEAVDDLSMSLRDWSHARFSEPAFYPYRELAKLKIPVFITTNPDNLLSEALTDQELQPHILFVPLERTHG